jgi:hypothetical protein
MKVEWEKIMLVSEWLNRKKKQRNDRIKKK